MNRYSRIAFLFLTGIPFLLQACAGTRITSRDLESVETITVARYKTPDLEVKTVSGAILTFSGGLLTAPLGAAIDVRASNKANQGVIFPDYGKLLVQDFMRIAPKEIPGWPKMKEANNPVEQGYEYKGGASIVFAVDHLWLTVYGGLTIEGDIVMRNQDGGKMFQRHFWYRSRDFGLRKNQEEYLTGNARLLIEEMPLAAEHTARELIIKPLKQGL